MVVSHHAKFQLITKTESRFFRAFFVEILRPPLLALVPEAGLRISGSDVRGSPQTKSGFIRLLATENVTVVEGRFRANCLLYGLEIFVAAAVMKAVTCVVQCYNNKSNHRADISLHQSLASGPAEEKWIMFVLTHNANSSSTREVFLLAVLITSRTSVSRGLFMSKDPSGRLFHCPFQLYGKKDPEKTRRKVPNLNVVEVVVCFFFNAPTVVQNLFSFNVF